MHSTNVGELLAEAEEVSGAGVSMEILTSTDAEGVVIGYTQITTIKDAADNSYETTAVFDAGGRMLQSSYSDSLGHSGSTEYQVVTGSDGAVMGYIQTSTSADSSGYTSWSTVELDANGNVSRSSYSDSAGNSGTTEYQFATGSDGASAGYTQTSTSTDAAGHTYDSSVTYDAIGRVIESSYADSAGNSTESVCKPNASSNACLSPQRRATKSHMNTAGIAAMPTSAQASGPWPASAGSRSTIATVNVALMTKPQPAAK